MRSLCIFAILVAVAAATCPGSPNLNPIYTDAPTFVKEVKNGKLYVAGQGEDQIHVMHVWGTPYERGYAHGELMTDAVQTVIKNYFNDIYTQIDQYLKFLPKDVQDFISYYGLDAALDVTYLLTKPYTASYWEEEMKGLADASGVDYIKIRNLHLVPELIKAGCSMYVAWGEAVPSNYTLVQLRALDFDMTANLQQYPLIYVVHPNATDGHTFASVGWAGWIAAVSGMSSANLAISEKYGGDFGTDSRAGIPFNYLLRDILQYDNTIDDSINRMTNAHRTCSIYIGVGDGNFGYGRVFEYAYSELNAWDDVNQPNTTDHPQIDQIVYRGVDQQCFASLLQQYRGAITPELTIREIIPVSQTGNLHAVLYDFDHGFMYVANAAAIGESGPENAYDRQFVRFDVNALWAELPPVA